MITLITDPYTLINRYHFSLIPSVNNYDEHLQFFIKGLNTSIIFRLRNEEIATKREHAAENFQAFKTPYAERTFLHTKHPPPCIANIQDLHTTRNKLHWTGILNAQPNIQHPTSNIQHPPGSIQGLMHHPQKNSLLVATKLKLPFIHSLSIKSKRNMIKAIIASNQSMSDLRPEKE